MQCAYHESVMYVRMYVCMYVCNTMYVCMNVCMRYACAVCVP